MIQLFRYLKYQDAAAKGLIDPSKLPPTEDSANLHLLRVFLQITIQKKLDQFCLDPCEWGWKKPNNIFEPIQTLLECAPMNLLKFVRCKCKTGCSSNLCSCKKHGLPCVPSCKNCHGDCFNSQVCRNIICSILLTILFSVS